MILKPSIALSFFLSCLLFLSAQPSHAGEIGKFCASLNDALATISPEHHTIDKGAQAKAIFPTAHQCDTAKALSGNVSLYCLWSYPFRHPEAKNAYIFMGKSAVSCEDFSAVEATKTGVNHPDTYAQSLFSSHKMSVSISLKDKAELEKTFLTVAITPVNRE